MTDSKNLMSNEYLTKVESYAEKIAALTADGEVKLETLQRQVNVIRRDKSISIDEQEKLFAQLNPEIEKANAFKAEHATELAGLRAEALEYINSNLNPIINEKGANLTAHENDIAAFNHTCRSTHVTVQNKLNELKQQLNKIKADCAAEASTVKGTTYDDQVKVCDIKDKYVKPYEEAEISAYEDCKKVMLDLQDQRETLYTSVSNSYREFIDYVLLKYNELSVIFAGKLPANELSMIRKAVNTYCSKVQKGYFMKGDFEENATNIQVEIDRYRSAGENKIQLLRDKQSKIKANKDYSKEDKSAMLARLYDDMQKAKEEYYRNRIIVDVLKAVGIGLVKVGNERNVIVNKYDGLVSIAKARALHELQKHVNVKANLKNEAELSELKASTELGSDRKIIIENKAHSVALERKSFKKENDEKFKRVQLAVKRANHEAFLHGQTLMTNYRNGKPSLGQTITQKARNYVYNFNLQKFLIKNAIYIIIVLFFIVCAIISPNLVSTRSLMNILSNTAIRLFYSLGVAGLILLAGTDLSVGRMIGMGAVLSTMMLQAPGKSYTFMGITFQSANLGFAGQLILAFLLPLVLCTLFSTVAGFFTAKFKMHPFISTLGTQLIIYGSLASATRANSTSAIDSSFTNVVTFGTKYYLGIIVFAIIALIIVWIIWNKTRFGKNLYAVGGNAEAAAVSGISVFKITLLAFVMAGILYGCGSFFEGVWVGTANSTYGYGYELNAIAACVVGGVSFNGGIGSIGGVVFGTLLFEMLQVCFTFLGLDTNATFIFKGIIILAAVTLDSLKYIKKK